MPRALGILRCEVLCGKANRSKSSPILKLFIPEQGRNETIAMTTEDVPQTFNCGRFAPSTTGRAHPGTLLAALLCWLDAKSASAEVVLRLEDLDRERTKSGYIEQMEPDLEWFGLEWDVRTLQSESALRHGAALDELAEAGRIYACGCSRAKVKASGQSAPDGSHAYAGTCRNQRVTAGEWRSESRPLRLHLEECEISLRDENGDDLSGDAASLFGDPVVRRRDGAFAYHFASVLDDSASGVDRVVRGRDLAPSTLLQVSLQRLFGITPPVYRHHCLFLERRDQKLSKLHGAVDLEALSRHYSAEELCGQLASFVGLVPKGIRCRPAELVSTFDWDTVSVSDIELGFHDETGLTSIR